MTSKLMLYEKQDVLGFMTDFYRDGEGNLYMTREQIGKCLGYASPSEAIRQIHKRNHELLDDYAIQVKFKKAGQIDPIYGTKQKYTGSGRGRDLVIMYKEQGIYLIAMKANTDKAMIFQKAVAGILENLRKGYQVWLLERERGKEARKTLTDTIRDKYPDSPHKKFMYKNFTNLVYKTALGKSFKELKEEYGEPLRDSLPSEMLAEVKRIEKAVDVFIDLGYNYDKIKGLLNPQLEE